MSRPNTPKSQLGLLRLGVALVAFLPRSAVAEGDSSVHLSGNVSTYAATGNRKLDDVSDVKGINGVLKINARLNRHVGLYVDLRHSLSPYGSANWYNGLREGYLSADVGNFSVRLGRQIIVWGRADKFNPTDNLTPTDYQILSPNDEAQRFGTAALQVQYFATAQYTVTGIVLPAFHSSILPSGLYPPQLTGSQPVQDYSLHTLEWALKLDKAGGRLDWSVSYYHGYALLPAVLVNSKFQPLLTNPRINVLGADFATTAGQFGFRGEAAYTRVKSATVALATPPKSYFYSVLGADRQVGWHVMVNVQWLYHHVYGFQNPAQTPVMLQPIELGNAAAFNQFHGNENGVAIRLSRNFMNDNLRTSLAALYYFEGADYAIRPKLIYAFNGHWVGSVFADDYQGPAHSYFGYLKKNSLVMAEITYEF